MPGIFQDSQGHLNGCSEVSEEEVAGHEIRTIMGV